MAYDSSQYQGMYFAALPSEELAHCLIERFEEWQDDVHTNRLKRKWIKSYHMYYGRHWKTNVDLQDMDILKLGDEGELQGVTVNHYRNLIKHILVLTTNQKPAFDVKAINSDHESLQQAKLANAILEAFLKEKRLRRHVRMAAEQSLVFGKSFVQIVWEPNSGKPLAPETYTDSDGKPRERIVYEGDVDLSVISPFDLYNDQTQEDWDKCEWSVIRKFKNKFNMAVRFAALRDKILELKTKDELDNRRVTTTQRMDQTADVPVYEFYHKRSDALPNGRYMLYAANDVVLYDGPIPYDRLPVFRITPGEIFGTTEGYTDAFDLMGPQQALNVLTSTAFTNESSFGVQSVLVPEGANLTHTQLSKGMSALSYNPAAGKPEPLQLTATPAEIFKNIEGMEHVMETLSGVNSVARGNPEASLKSGVALGIVQSMAVQFASAFQESYAELLEDCGTFILSLLKNFADTQRIVSMSGRWNRGALRYFTKDDLTQVDKVTVELGNPMARTTAGRVAIADNLLERGLVRNPKEYITVLQTGQLDPLLQGEEMEIGLIHRENDRLADGGQVGALVFDQHLLHIREHKSLLSDPMIREQSGITQNVLMHIQQHMDMYRLQDPVLSMITGDPPPPQMLPPGMTPEGGTPPAGAETGPPQPPAEVPIEEVMQPEAGPTKGGPSLKQTKG